jgi:uncharacterized membrane protein YbhN (UPF0104 family)
MDLGSNLPFRVMRRGGRTADNPRVRLPAVVGRTVANRRVVILLSTGVALVAAALTGRYFVEIGWPLHRADALLVGVAGGLSLAAHSARTLGWRRLFSVAERPGLSALAAASGAASLVSVALPGKFDTVVRVAVVRRFPGGSAGLGTVCLSLVVLGMIEAAALMPLAGVAAGTGSSPSWLQAGLIVVAAAGAGSLAAVFALPRLTGAKVFARFRAAGWLARHATCPRETTKALALVSVSWLCRAAALLVLLEALGLKASIPLALVLLCASAASSIVPVAPAGAAMQAGAAAAVLAASGVAMPAAVAFGLAAQLLLVLAGGALALGAGLWHGASVASLRWRAAAA